MKAAIPKQKQRFPNPDWYGRHITWPMAGVSSCGLDEDYWQASTQDVKTTAQRVSEMASMIQLASEVQCLRASLDAERKTTANLRAELEQQRREALTDPLTGLYNRRAMDQRLGEIWADPGEEQLAIMVLDIDFFKRINDTYGHADGDSVIRWVAATLCRCIRIGDSAFRYGGEEFMVLLPDTTLDGAISVAESIRGRIEAHHLAIPRNWQVPLTVSLGVASRNDQDDPISLFARADRALYQAKQTGRNRVMHENSVI